jgi:Homeodomain-like domain-containing protein
MVSMNEPDPLERLTQLRDTRAELDRVQALLTEDIRKAIAAAHEAGMSGAEIAAHLGMSRQAVNRIYLPKRRKGGTVAGVIVGALIAVLFSLAMTAPAGASWPAPLTDEAKLAAYLPIARASWPGSPCQGREVVHLRADAELAADDAIDHVDSYGRGIPDTCEVFLHSNLGALGFCSVLAHELGHLAGYGHTDDPTTTHPNGAEQLQLMNAHVSLYYPPCVKAIGWAAAATSDATAMLTRLLAGWTIYCGHHACLASRPRSCTRRYYFAASGAIEDRVAELCPGRHVTRRLYSPIPSVIGGF